MIRLSRPRKQPLWFRDIRKGDVLRAPSGLLRVVRKATFFPSGELSCVTFSIRACSWTHRPYTVVNYTDLVALGYAATGVRVELNQRIDKELERAMEIVDRTKHPKCLDCCDVKGIS